MWDNMVQNFVMRDDVIVTRRVPPFLRVLCFLSSRLQNEYRKERGARRE